MLLDDFLSEYWPREETLEEVWGWVLGRTHGHLHLSGPSGSGKSWLLRGLAVGAQERGAVPLYLEKSPDESLTSLVWRMVDATEYLLDIDGESLRLAVSQAFYEQSPPKALLAAFQWLTQEIDSSFVILFDGFEEAVELSELPAWKDFAEGIYLVTAGRARHPVDQLVLQPEHPRNLEELDGYLRKRLDEEMLGQVEQILVKSQGNWRLSYYYALLLKWKAPLPEPESLFDSLFEALGRRLGPEIFRTVHLEILILLAVAQVPVSLELFKAWSDAPEKVAFALFELRDFLSSDGEGSQYDALFTGEHYSLRSPELRDFLLQHPSWRDRVSESHRRVVALALDSSRPTNPNPQDADFYAHCFLKYHLAESGRMGDLSRLMHDQETVEKTWALGRLAREQGYEEIGLQLFLVSAHMLERKKAQRSRRFAAQLAEIYADCCHTLTNQGRYSDGAHFGEQALDMLRALVKNERNDNLEGLLTHCLLCLADPYLYMGYVQRAYPLYQEAHQRSLREGQADQAKTIHALRGQARSARALGNADDSLRHGQEALDLARKLTREEGEEWAQYLFELLMEQSETLRGVRETLPETAGPLEHMGMRWESMRLLGEAEGLYHQFQWPGDQELVFLYLEQSMALFDLEKWNEAEERLRKAITVINSLPAGESNPADVASLEFLRSHALALMNRIGEASGSLNTLLTPEMMQGMDLSEQALVLFFRAKILSHQGLLRQAEEALEQCIDAYQQAIGLGAEDLSLEQLSARVYQARVRARRGRLQEAMEIAEACRQELLDFDPSEGAPQLELADVRELQAWIYLHMGQPEAGLECLSEAEEALDHIRATESEADVETERSVCLSTEALLQSALGHHDLAAEKAQAAVEIEQRRAQEGYDQARMWCAIHRQTLARVQRQANRHQAALEVVTVSLQELSGLPGNQRNHLGLHLAAAQLELARAQLALEQWNLVREPLRAALAMYENEMWQSKEYLIAPLLDCQRLWLTFCRLSANPEWQDRSCWQELFEGWVRWQAHRQEEADNEFVIRARAQLQAWIRSLEPKLLKEWDQQAPSGLHSKAEA